MFAQLDARHIDRARRSLVRLLVIYCSHSRNDEATTWNISRKRREETNKICLFVAFDSFYFIVVTIGCHTAPGPTHVCRLCLYLLNEIRNYWTAFLIVCDVHLATARNEKQNTFCQNRYAICSQVFTKIVTITMIWIAQFIGNQFSAPQTPFVFSGVVVPK